MNLDRMGALLGVPAAKVEELLRTEEGRHQIMVAAEAEKGRRSLADFIRLAWGRVVPDPLKWNWHIDAMSEHLEAVTAGLIKRLVICIPPGFMKSLEVATFWPAWEWIQDPTLRYIFSAYAQDLASKNAKLHRDLVLSDWYRERWKHVQISPKEGRKINMFENTAKGWRFSVGLGGGVIGRHADRLVFDDLAKTQDAQGKAAVRGDALKKANDFWFKTMATRRARPAETAMVGIMQRLHHEDPAGKCIDAGYDALVLPMEYDPARKCQVEITGWEDPRTEEGELLWPDRYPQETVDEIRTSLGSLAASAQLDQNPTPREGAIFKLPWFQTRWTKLPQSGLRMWITADCTFKDHDATDLVALHAWGFKDGKAYLVDRVSRRMGVLDTAQAIVDLKAKWPKAVGVYIEDKANGPAIFQILKHLKVKGINEWSPGRNGKEERAEAVSPLCEAGDVYLPDESVAPWIGEVVTQLTQFPLGAHDDDVDAMTMSLLLWISKSTRNYKKAVAKGLGLG